MNGTTGRPAGITARHWMIVVGSGLLMAMAVMLFLASGLMLPPLAESIGAGLSQVMVFVSINFITGAVVMTAAGPFLTQRVGLRPLVIAGGAFTGACLFAVSLVGDLTQLYLAAFAAGLLGTASLQMSGTALINEWFARSRGLMLGLVMSIGGIGGLFAGAVLPQVVLSGGWQLGFQVLGGLTVAVALLCGVFLIRSRPSDVGLTAYGAHAEDHELHTASVAGLPAATALKTPQFAALVLGLTLWNALMAVQQHFAPLMAERGLDLVATGSLISLLSILAIGSTLLFGGISDRAGPLVAIILSGLLLVVALATMLLTAGYWPQAAAILLFSIPAVTPPIITPIVLRHVFGGRAFASLLGVAMATMPAGVALGSPLWGVPKDATGSYDTAILVAIGLTVAIVGLVSYAVITGPKLWRTAPAHHTAAGSVRPGS
ncbi:MAG: MFS transporter [Micropruina sp.]